MDQLNTDLTALQAVVQNVVNDVATLPTPSSTSTDPNDAVVAAFVTSLTSAGWTVTPPTSEPELPEGQVAPNTPSADLAVETVSEVPTPEAPSTEA